MDQGERRAEARPEQSGRASFWPCLLFGVAGGLAPFGDFSELGASGSSSRAEHRVSSLNDIGIVVRTRRALVGVRFPISFPGSSGFLPEGSSGTVRGSFDVPFATSRTYVERHKRSVQTLVSLSEVTADRAAVRSGTGRKGLRPGLVIRVVHELGYGIVEGKVASGTARSSSILQLIPVLHAGLDNHPGKHF